MDTPGSNDFHVRHGGRGTAGGVSPRVLLETVGLPVGCRVRWGDIAVGVPDAAAAGVYVVSADADPSTGLPAVGLAVPEEACRDWLRGAPDLALDRVHPDPATLAARLASWLLPAEAVVYIGKAGAKEPKERPKTVAKRLKEFYDTVLGERTPHGGGRWTKTLAGLDDFTVHYALTPDGVDPEDLEQVMLRQFGLLASVPGGYPDPGLVLPYGNLERKRLPDDRPRLPYTRRRHGVRKPHA